MSLFVRLVSAKRLVNKVTLTRPLTMFEATILSACQRTTNPPEQFIIYCNLLRYKKHKHVYSRSKICATKKIARETYETAIKGK